MSRNKNLGGQEGIHSVDGRLEITLGVNGLVPVAHQSELLILVSVYRHYDTKG